MGVAHGLVGLQFQQIALGHRLAEVAALHRADGLLADVGPAVHRLARREQQVDAGFGIAGLHCGGNHAAGRRVADGGDQDIDIAQLQFLKAVFRGDADLLQAHAQALGNRGRDVAFKADHLALGIQGVEWAEVGFFRPRG
jgi:hypothetical protein